MARQVVVSRYKEDIRWIQDSPLPVIVYNKGPKLHNVYGAECVSLPNIGREGHTYLHHIVSQWDRLADYTIFTQADPLEHSPDFIKLLSYPFTQTQPLSWRWKEWDDVFCVGAIPPRRTRLMNRQYWVDDCRIHVEYLNQSLQPVMPKYYFDFGRYLFLRSSRRVLKVSKEETLLSYFWRELFGNSETLPAVIPFCFAGIFGVPKNVIQNRSKSFYENCMRLLLKHDVNGYVFERLWLSLFAYEQTSANRYLELRNQTSRKIKNRYSVRMVDLFKDPGFWRFLSFGLGWCLITGCFAKAKALAARTFGFAKG